jgi:hypothetical protein
MAKIAQFRWTDAGIAKLRRMDRLPVMAERIAMGKFKTYAKWLVKAFQDGISNDKLNLERLKTETIIAKARKGLPQPATPLYGKGKSVKNSFVNMLIIREIENGYLVAPKLTKHHKAKLTLDQLHKIHEYGCTIATKNGGLIRIPPRPALRLAWEETKREIKKDTPVLARKIEKALTIFINTANTGLVKEFENQDTTELTGQ